MNTKMTLWASSPSLCSFRNKIAALCLQLALLFTCTPAFSQTSPTLTHGASTPAGHTAINGVSTNNTAIYRSTVEDANFVPVDGSYVSGPTVAPSISGFSIPANQNFMFEFWVKQSALTNTNNFANLEGWEVGLSDGANFDRYMSTDGTFRLRLYSNGTERISEEFTNTVNVLEHIRIVRIGTKYYYFCNGVAVGNYNYGSAAAITSVSFGSATLGVTTWEHMKIQPLYNANFTDNDATDEAAPDAPTAVAVANTALATELRVSWTAPADNGTTYYYYGDGVSSTTGMESNLMTHTNTGFELTNPNSSSTWSTTNTTGTINTSNVTTDKFHQKKSLQMSWASGNNNNNSLYYDQTNYIGGQKYHISAWAKSVSGTADFSLWCNSVSAPLNPVNGPASTPSTTSWQQYQMVYAPNSTKMRVNLTHSGASSASVLRVDNVRVRRLTEYEVVSGIQGYEVEQTSPNAGTDYAWSASNPQTITGLLPNTQYCFKVRARDNAITAADAADKNEGPWSSGTVCKWTRATQTTAFTATAACTSGTISLNWSGGAWSNVRLRCTETGTDIYSGSASAFTHSGLTAGTTYHYTLYVRNGEGLEETTTSTASATPVLFTTPQAVANVTVGSVVGGTLLADANLTSSGAGTNAESWRGRLFNYNSGVQAWTAQNNTMDLTQYLQIDLGTQRTIDGIVTQGRGDANQWVTSYEVRVSLDNGGYTTVGTFTANSDRNTAVTNIFDARQWGRYVRIYPTGISGGMSMRAEVISIPCAPSATVYANTDLASGVTAIKWYSEASGGSLLGTGQQISQTISANTVVYVEPTYGSCPAPSRTAVTMKINAPVGNPTVFGDNEWKVYGYFKSDQSLATTTFAGNYTQNLISCNTEDLAANGWNFTDGPSYSTGWAGCPLPKDNFTFTQKRKGFPCGTYAVDMVNWDDGTTVYINGVQQWVCNAWGGSNSCPLSVGTFMLDGNSEVELRTEENGGDARATISMVAAAPTALAANGSSRTCYASGTTFIDFVDVNGKLIGSINPNGNNLGNVTMTSYVSGPVNVQACGTTSPSYVSAAMGRRWVATPQYQPSQNGNPNNPVYIRLPFDDTPTTGELASLITAANATVSAVDNITGVGNLKLNKYSGPNNVDGIASNNCTSAGGSGGTTVHNQSAGSGPANGTVVSLYAGFNANAKYTTFQVPGFSEFWLGGSSNASPLPVELTNFSASCTGSEVNLSWSTASEHNSLKFIVEKSRDMEHWNYVTEHAASGNSNYNLDYASADHDPYGGISYYRLVQVDQDGVEKIYEPVSVSCGERENSMTVFPNPSHGEFTVEISSTESIGGAQIQITDLTGKIISMQPVNLLEGKNHVLFNGMNLQLGTYTVRLIASDQQFTPVMVVNN